MLESHIACIVFKPHVSGNVKGNRESLADSEAHNRSSGALHALTTSKHRHITALSSEIWFWVRYVLIMTEKSKEMKEEDVRDVKGVKHD
jgi:hypothetical protein